MPLKLYRRGKNGTFHYRGTIGPTGRRKFFSGSCKTSNQDIAARQVAEIEAGYWKGHFDGPGAILTFAQAAVMYRAAGKGDKFLAPVEKYLDATLVKDINPGIIQAMAMALYPHWSMASRNRGAIIPAQAVINHAAESGLCQRIRVKRFKPDTKEKPFVTLEWLKKFGKEASPQLYAYGLFMFLTGARPTEALEADIDLPSRTALLHESKIGHERRAHLPAMLVAILGNLPEIKGRPLFFYRKIADLEAAWNRAVERADIQFMTRHCCRHGFITGLLRQKFDVKTVAWLADMTVETLVKTYAHAIKDRTLTDALVNAESVQPVSTIAENLLKTGTS
jgi:integrase